MYAAIRLPAGETVYHDGKRWVCYERTSKTLVDYFAKTLPEAEYPDPVAATILHVVTSMVGAELLTWQPQMVVESGPPDEHLVVK